MKRVIFLITIIVLVLSIDYFSNTIIDFFNSSKTYTISSSIKDSENKIKEIENEIKDKNKVVSEVEKKNEDKVKLLEVWQKEKEKTNS